jgi:transposase
MARAQKSRSNSPSGKPRSKSRAQRNNRAKLKPQDVKLELQVVHPRAAGIDVGNEEHWVAVPPELDPQHPVQSFGCFTQDLGEMGDWLVGLGIDTVALQSTGVYWIGLHDILAQRGIRVFVVNAADTKNLPGRKTDIQECQWLLRLHTYGLLKNSFRPGGGHSSDADVLAAEAAAYRGRLPVHSAYAEGADPNERATGQCD